jgi:hypothetical protein
MQNIIKEKTETSRINRIKKMVNYCLKNRHRYKNIKIDDEVNCIQFYVYNVLRSCEPFNIKNTLSYCYGSTDLVKEFMENKIGFMVEMQFLSNEDDIMIYLIQEQWLYFKSEKGLIYSKECSSRLFPLIIKKLEAKLTMKVPFDDFDVILYVQKDKFYYKIETVISNLIGTKFIIANNYERYVTNKKSKCHKSIKVNLKRETSWKKINRIPTKMEVIKGKSFIEPRNECYLNSKKNIAVVCSTYSLGNCYISNYTLYLANVKKQIGSFEFNTDDNDFSYVSLMDISTL